MGSVPIDSALIDRLLRTSLVQPRAAEDRTMIKGHYKAACSDFIVEEELGFEPNGSGEHLFVYVEKEGLTTLEAADLLARAASVSSRGIGYSGMKDKQAITRQWFSLPTNDDPDVSQLASSLVHSKRLEILTTTRNSKKLRIGSHKQNHFQITLRKLQREEDGEGAATSASTAEVIESRLDVLSRSGFPNYFGPQRFGYQGRNVYKAVEHLNNPRKRLKPKQRGLYISSLRSALFNHVLSERVANQTWLNPMLGEALMLSGSHSVFGYAGENADDIHHRLASFDISTTGPLVGAGDSPIEGDCQQFESEVLTPYQSVCEALVIDNILASRRALRVAVQSLDYRWLTQDDLLLSFKLPPGSYASMLIHHLSDGIIAAESNCFSDNKAGAGHQ
ncbi:MAG: tRNA pseudouridine(13) synthase TruD [Gammaproteobacteria bacterium]|nr:tRNA pseudouridine(13) synthase TruD [Gammaproteobacteria bacterium]